eukprot:Awhi_evm1s5940
MKWSIVSCLCMCARVNKGGKDSQTLLKKGCPLGSYAVGIEGSYSSAINSARIICRSTPECIGICGGSCKPCLTGATTNTMPLPIVTSPIPTGLASEPDSGTNVSFEHSGATPHTFQILPPAGLFRHNSQCVRRGDRFVLSSLKTTDAGVNTPYCGMHGCNVGRVQDSALVFGKGNFATPVVFSKVRSRRQLEWKDHVIINTGFSAGGSPYGDSNLYTDSTDENVELMSGLKATGLHPHTTFRLLPGAAERYSEGCIRWNSKIVLKLNNLVVDPSCDTQYGCRTAHLDSDSKFRFRQPVIPENPTSFILRPPVGREASGCIRSGDQVRIVESEAETSALPLIAFQIFE